jgi:hypothetical protein
MTLSKTDFDFLLKNLKSALLQNHQLRHINDEHALSNKATRLDTVHGNKPANNSGKRRISGFDEKGHRSEQRMGNLLKRMGKYMFESLYDSLYSRMYREILLSEAKALEYGHVSARVLAETSHRNEAVKMVREQVKRILEMEPTARTVSDNAFIGGLMRQRNMVRDKLCQNWPAYQFNDICKKLRIVRVKPMRRVSSIAGHGNRRANERTDSNRPSLPTFPYSPNDLTGFLSPIECFIGR